MVIESVKYNYRISPTGAIGEYHGWYGPGVYQKEVLYWSVLNHCQFIRLIKVDLHVGTPHKFL